jgi:hypothetical protein
MLGVVTGLGEEDDDGALEAEMGAQRAARERAAWERPHTPPTAAAPPAGGATAGAATHVAGAAADARVSAGVSAAGAFGAQGGSPWSGRAHGAGGSSAAQPIGAELAAFRAAQSSKAAAAQRYEQERRQRRLRRLKRALGAEWLEAAVESRRGSTAGSAVDARESAAGEGAAVRAGGGAAHKHAHGEQEGADGAAAGAAEGGVADGRSSVSRKRITARRRQPSLGSTASAAAAGRPLGEACEAAVVPRSGPSARGGGSRGATAAAAGAVAQGAALRDRSRELPAVCGWAAEDDAAGPEAEARRKAVQLEAALVTVAACAGPAAPGAVRAAAQVGGNGGADAAARAQLAAALEDCGLDGRGEGAGQCWV